MIRIIKKIIFMLFVIIRWLPKAINFYLLAKKNKPIHIFFCLTDHYEPGSGHVSAQEAKARVNRLVMQYPNLVNKHRDCEGIAPKRTWFFPPHYHENFYLKNLVSLCEQGYGEIELHLHHGKHTPDTSENLRETIKLCIDEYAKFGIFGKQNNQSVYGFIHGDWALDNSRHNQFCGVNNEIDILKETGCYADFTFPSPNDASPQLINTIFYAKEDPNQPKSHNTGNVVTANSIADKNALMIIQGPVYPFFKEQSYSKPRVSGDEISGVPPFTPDRIDACIQTSISIKGKEDWIFVKMHTHGATDGDAVLGKEIDDAFSYLESKYNDGKKYCLHYVTARETYNIIKAIENGELCQDPAIYRDYLISKPIYDSSPKIASASSELKARVAKTYKN